ncbi:hypothetical protein BDZ94DRAFT_891658 [Collybia nuda]|uniref:Uncharacterized protein n=1 Tax=Collybia nuda TaxID=64659 RepID=A0A9P5Y1L7_9AGAR|nr:hypothetical protein BDZ94DRAFT_891658 [Collybia nuda]
MNWKTQSFFFLPLSHAGCNLAMTVIPGHLFIYSECCNPRCSALHLYVYDRTSFEPHWSTDLTLPHKGLKTSPKITPIWAQTCQLPHSHKLEYLELSAHVHQFYPYRHTLWAVRSSTKHGSRHCTFTIERYILDLKNIKGVSIQLKSSAVSFQNYRCLNECGISSTGYALWSGKNFKECVASVGEQAGGGSSRTFDDNVSNQAERIHLQITPYSGVIVALPRGKDTLHIDYYE